jgi:hypothetical protein
MTKTIALSTVKKLPTSNKPNEVAWKIATPTISCGIHQLQGWSAGVGIHGNDNLEEKLFLLTYFSANQKKFTGEIWSTHNMPGLVIAPIAVSGNLWQFLRPKQNYLISSQLKWVDRFEAFLKKYDLGELHRTEGFSNPNWHEGKICCAIWVWNGKHPAPADFNYTED